MDNLTHSLIGAALGQAGLKRKTGLAIPALIIAANLPDIDAPCVMYGVESLAMRRGITHGPIALVLLPLVLAGLLIAFDRWQTRRGKRPDKRPPVHAGWLIALCYIGTFTHPLFDWFNNYGIRLLEPISSDWFYGDTLFIIDPWIWAMLGFGVWKSIRREQAGLFMTSWPAHAALLAVGAYVVVNLGISRFIESLARMTEPYPEVVVTSPVPLAFWRREVLWRAHGKYGSYTVDFPFTRSNEVAPRPTNMADPRVTERASRDKAAQAFLFWSRMPVAEIWGDGIELQDQRFKGIPSRGPFTVELEPKP